MESTSARPAAKEKKGLSKWWKRVKAAFKDKEITPASAASTTQTPASKATHEPTKDTSKSTDPQASTTIAAQQTDTAAPADPPMQTDIDRRLARARELFKKYDFEFDEADWKADDSKRAKPTERVQKNIRMRVKYTCHTCNTVFGHDKVCISCQHPRCNKCIRYPPRKPKGQKKQAAVAAPGADKASANKCACHECQTGFEIGTEECPNCHHKICDQCLKESLVAISPPPARTEPQKKPAPSEPPITAPVTTSVR